MSYAVAIEAYDPQWPQKFAVEAPLIRQAMGEVVVDVQHIGSTSVPGLAAKPVIDILVGVSGPLEMSAAQIEAMAAIGYEYRGDAGVEGRLFLRKGGASRSHHCHVVRYGDQVWRGHLLFRDYLRAHPTDREAYAALKQELALQYSAAEQRAVYTESKAPFIQGVLERARAWDEAGRS